MSYDIYLSKPACPTCGHHERHRGDLPNPTYNLTQIFDLALTNEPFPNPEVGEGGVVLFREPTDRPRGLRVLSGRKASETYSQIHTALERLEDPKRLQEWRDLEPPNKWGTLETAIKVLQQLRTAAHDSPDFVWEIH